MTQLSILLNDWKQDEKVSAFLASCYDQGQNSGNEVLESKEDPLHILATSMQKVNVTSPAEFSLSSQFDVEEPETYKQAINGLHTQQ